MSPKEDQSRWFVLVASLVGALTGQHELTEEDRRAVAEWVVDHADVTEIRDLLVQVVATQIIDTSEFRTKVAEAIRKKFETGDQPPEVD
jgi:hypothetical protein